jgi:tetratricopeptide (TPR) repeat protein
MGTGDLTEAEQGTLDRIHEHASAGNHYGVLGVAPDSNTEDIQSAYYQLSRDWHPDRHFRRDLGDYAKKLQFIFIQITKAYKVLSDKDGRRRFDRDNQKLIAAMVVLERPKATSKSRKVDPQSPEALAARKRRRAKRKEEHINRKRLAAKPRDARSRAIQQLKAQMKGRVGRATRYFVQGKEDYDQGNTTKAVSALHLACQFEPDNKEYRALYELARRESRTTLAQRHVEAGESAESMSNYREAIHQYTEACKMKPLDGLPHYRLANLLIQVEHNKRDALAHLRDAVSKTPKSTDYRLALADLYADLNMGLNAKREYQTILQLDGNNQRAKTGLRNVR